MFDLMITLKSFFPFGWSHSGLRKKTEAQREFWMNTDEEREKQQEEEEEEEADNFYRSLSIIVTITGGGGGAGK